MLKRLWKRPRASLRSICVPSQCVNATFRSDDGSRCQPTGSKTWVKDDDRRLFSGLTRLRQEILPVKSHDEDALGSTTTGLENLLDQVKCLPAVCPGCGAHSQTVEPASPGYYDLSKLKTTKRVTQQQKEEDSVFRAALERVSINNSNHQSSYQAPSSPPSSPEPPICTRCHTLQHHSRGTPILHPSTNSLQTIIEASPHNRNHIYHILDAADFPLSLIPNLQHALDLPPLRTRNRRSKSLRYSHGHRVAEVSFIITRGDLLAPLKEQVDGLLPYMQEVLRGALGRNGRRVRLGNVRLVSAKRGWWTRLLKEEIWGRGGAGWMVGKANVGKSALVEVVFPKGRSKGGMDEKVLENRKDEQSIEQLESSDKIVSENWKESSDAQTLVEGGIGESLSDSAKAEPAFTIPSSEQANGAAITETKLSAFEKLCPLDEDKTHDEPYPDDTDVSLLPPPQPETPYPRMPVVSALPGTTASPIRLPFGNGKGELIDLPGIHRSDLATHVLALHHKHLVMTDRVVPEQQIIRPGQSLLLGGLIRITPVNLPCDARLMAYPFLPSAFAPHVTGTHKAVAIQTGMHSSLSRGREGEKYAGTVSSIATEAAKANMRSAGRFRLQWDVTKRRAGPLTHPAAGKQKAENLPFVVYSADLLVEGAGWVELVCQVRRRWDSFLPTADDDSVEDAFGVEGERVPEVEVFSPLGQFVGVRRPMNAWLLGGPKKTPKRERRRRPRATIGMQRRREANKRE